MRVADACLERADEYSTEGNTLVEPGEESTISIAGTGRTNRQRTGRRAVANSTVKEPEPAFYASSSKRPATRPRTRRHQLGSDSRLAGQPGPILLLILAPTTPPRGLCFFPMTASRTATRTLCK